jgi:hypothetical protein
MGQCAQRKKWINKIQDADDKEIVKQGAVKLVSNPALTIPYAQNAIAARKAIGTMPPSWPLLGYSAIVQCVTLVVTAGESTVFPSNPNIVKVTS